MLKKFFQNQSNNIIKIEIFSTKLAENLENWQNNDNYLFTFFCPDSHPCHYNHASADIPSCCFSIPSATPIRGNGSGLCLKRENHFHSLITTVILQ